MHNVHISTGFMLVLVILILGLAGLATWLLVAFMNRNKNPVEDKHKQRKSNQSVFRMEDQEPVRIPPVPPYPPALPALYPTIAAQTWSQYREPPRTTGYSRRTDDGSYVPTHSHSSNNTSDMLAAGAMGMVLGNALGEHSSSHGDGGDSGGGCDFSF